jgi:Flp pilus assembly protein TadG
MSRGSRATRLRSARGSAFVELAMTLPILVVVLFAMADFARAYHVAMQLSNMARAGAQAGARTLATSAQANLTAAVRPAAQAAGSITGVTADVQQLCYCAADGGTYFGPTDCLATVTCAPGGPGHIYVYVQVDASVGFVPVTRFPGLPGNFTLTRRATMRVPN